MNLKEQIKGAAKTIVLLLLLISCLWGYIGTRIGVWGPLGYIEYTICVIGIQPLGYDLWHGYIKPGDSMSELLENVNPYSVKQYGKWTELNVTPGCKKAQKGSLLLGDHIWIVAKSDRMVIAGFGGCTFQREFFNILTPAENAERAKDLEDYVSQKQQMMQDKAQPPPGN